MIGKFREGSFALLVTGTGHLSSALSAAGRQHSVFVRSSNGNSGLGSAGVRCAVVPIKHYAWPTVRSSGFAVT